MTDLSNYLTAAQRMALAKLIDQYIDEFQVEITLVFKKGRLRFLRVTTSEEAPKHLGITNDGS